MLKKILITFLSIVCMIFLFGVLGAVLLRITNISMLRDGAREVAEVLHLHS